LRTNYITLKKSTVDISNETNISVATIHRRLVKLGLSRSAKEAATTPRKVEKTKATNLKNYGYEHNFCKDHPSRKKWEKRLLDEEGIVNVFQRAEVKEKISKTLIEKYGVESPSKIITARGKNVYSSIHKLAVGLLQKEGIEVKIEKKIPKKNGYFYSFDIVIHPKILIEINGDYWHGNPRIYKPTDIILKGSSKEVLVSDKWASDKKKIAVARRRGYSVLVIWESDLKSNPKREIKRILDAKKRKDKKYSKNPKNGQV
jgi:G:T-mismatch repair DNA endonuclease (very short patch repair protein)